MPRKKHSEMAAGLFVVAAVAVALGVVMWLGASDVFRKARQQAYFYVPESSGPSGLTGQNSVLINDAEIGKITEVRHMPAKGLTMYVADIERENVRIYSDGKAQVAASVVGVARLVITDRGSDKAPLADEDHPVQIHGGLDRAMGDIAAAAENLRKVTDTVVRELDATQGAALVGKVHSVVDDLKSTAADMATIATNLLKQTDVSNADSMLARVQASAANVQAATASLAREASATQPASLMAKTHKSLDDVNAMTADAGPKVGRTLTAAADTAEKIRDYTNQDVAAILADLRQSNTEILKIARNFAAVSEQTQQIVLLNRENIDEMIDNMAAVSANLKAASKDIRRNPWRLLYKPTPGELDSQNLYDAARDFSNGAEQLDQALTRLTGLAKASPNGVSVDDPQLQSIRKQLEETFANFTKAEQALWKELQVE